MNFFQGKGGHSLRREGERWEPEVSLELGDLHGRCWALPPWPQHPLHSGLKQGVSAND